MVYTWDYNLGVPLSIEDTQGRITTWEYDRLGRTTKETRSDGTYSDFTYVDCVGCWSSNRGRYYVNRLDSDGLETRDYRDRYGRSIGGYRHLPTGTQSREMYVYDSLGRLDAQYVPWVHGETAYIVDYDYDLLGRLVEEERPTSETVANGSVTTANYQGLTRTVTNPENQVTTTRFDPLGRAIKVTDALNGEVEYQYTAFDELHKSWDPADNLTTINYNNRGDKTSSAIPGMGTWTYTYTVFGEPKTQTDAKSQTTTFNYNQLGFPTTRIDAEGTTTWNHYTSADHKLWLTSSVTSPGNFSESYGYDTLSRVNLVTTTLDGAAYATNFSYHTTGPGKGKLKRITYPTSTSGVRFKVDYDYDAWGYLETAKNGDSPSTVYYRLNETDALGRERLAEFGNGLDEDRTYDRANGSLKSIKTGPNLTATVQNLTYAWDKVGNLRQRKDLNQNRTEDFTYDVLNRIKTAELDSVQTLSVNYNNIGNITSKSDVGTYTYGEGSAGPNSVTTITGARPGAFSYDANGNMYSRAGDTITWYSYNKPNRINYGSDYTEFKYGPDRSRFKQISRTGSSTTTTYYVGTHFEKETTGGITKYRHHIRAGGKLVAIHTRPTSGPLTTRYIHRDHLGSIVALSNESGLVSEEYSFDAFGKRRNVNWTADPGDSRFLDSHLTERGYTGHEHLDNVRLIHMNGRVQDPAIGRMVSADPFVPNPLDSQSHNRKSYVRNRPLVFVDPTGFWDDEPARPQTRNEYCFGRQYLPICMSHRHDYGMSEREIDQADEREAEEERHSRGIPRAFGTAIVATGQYIGSYGTEIAMSQSVRTGVGAAVGTSLLDGPLPVGEALGVGIVVSVVGGVVIDKAAADISRMIESTRKWAQRPGEVYTLRAQRNGAYPDVQGGTVILQAGDIWKIGQSLSGPSRYPAGVYRSLGLTYNTEYVGGQLQITMMEKLRLAGYVTTHGRLPPGNRILR